MNTKSILSYLLVAVCLTLAACGETADNQEKKGDAAYTETTTVDKADASSAETTPELRTTEVSPQEAVKIAEAFVRRQGYTEQKVNVSKAITFEQGEFASDTAKLLDNRRNTLQAKAMGARQYGSNFSWAVGFRQIPYENNIVRAVMMDSLGNNVKIAPQVVREDWIMGNNQPPPKQDEN